jgi:hypothetical protein
LFNHIAAESMLVVVFMLPNANNTEEALKFLVAESESNSF